jgi:hypothetical protein
VRTAEGYSYFLDFYCVTVVLLGAFVVLNLMIAVQSNYLDMCIAEVERLAKEEEKKHQKELSEAPNELFEKDRQKEQV